MARYRLSYEIRVVQRPSIDVEFDGTEDELIELLEVVDDCRGVQSIEDIGNKVNGFSDRIKLISTCFDDGEVDDVEGYDLFEITED